MDLGADQAEKLLVGLQRLAPGVVGGGAQRLVLAGQPPGDHVVSLELDLLADDRVVGRPDEDEQHQAAQQEEQEPDQPRASDGGDGGAVGEGEVLVKLADGDHLAVGVVDGKVDLEDLVAELAVEQVFVVVVVAEGENRLAVPRLAQLGGVEHLADERFVGGIEDGAVGTPDLDRLHMGVDAGARERRLQLGDAGGGEMRLGQQAPHMRGDDAFHEDGRHLDIAADEVLKDPAVLDEAGHAHQKHEGEGGGDDELAGEADPLPGAGEAVTAPAIRPRSDQTSGQGRGARSGRSRHRRLDLVI